jgi:hypothetical protein
MEPYVPAEKILFYLLNEPGKAKFFTRFGYSLETWEKLSDDLLQLPAQYPAVFRADIPQGRLFEIIGEVSTPNGSVIKLITGWIILHADPQTLRFVTAYPA